MADSESKAQLSVNLKGILDHTSSWARVLEDGRIELEYYDFSPGANDNFGNDVAWMYYIEAAQKPRLYELLEALTGTPIADDQAMLDAFLPPLSRYLGDHGMAQGKRRCVREGV